jgi:radical SAM protein with 4Fe4S-binding SPASM domain
MELFQLTKRLNFLWKKIAQILAQNCEKCGNPRLYSVFDTYTGTPSGCITCKTVYYAVLPFMKAVFGKTHLKKEYVKQLLNDTLVCKSMLNVVKGINHFGLTMPQPTAVPVVIVWNYTNMCNLTCLHCHQNSGVLKQSELTTEQVYTIIEKLSNAGVSILTFSGGEPLVCPHIFDAIQHAHNAGLLCTIASNGTLMTSSVVEKLRKAGIKRVEIGLDGCTAKTHDFLRNTPGAFDATVQGIKNCVKTGFDEICATMTLYKKNYDELKGTIELAEKLGVTRFYLNRLIPAGRGKTVMDLDVTREQKIKALEYLYSKFYKSATTGEGIQCYSRGMTYYGRLGYEKSHGNIFTVSEALSGHDKLWKDKFGNNISKIIQNYPSWFGGCSAGITYAGLSPTGDLLPCVPAHIPLGNILEEDLEDMWCTNELLQVIRSRDELTGSCGECGYNFVCGGCRYTAYAVTGNWLKGDPSCPFGPD